MQPIFFDNFHNYPQFCSIKVENNENHKIPKVNMENKNKLLPDDYIKDSIETYIYKHTTKSQIIYIVVMLAVTLALVALPFIYVDITVQGSGTIRPKAERSIITAPISEIVDEVCAHEGQYLEKGDCILKFRTNTSESKLASQESQLCDMQQQMADLAILARGQKPTTFASPARHQEYISYISQQQQLHAEISQYQTEWKRNKALYDQKVISEEEYNTYYYQYINKKNELETLIRNQESKWQTDFNNLKNEKAEMKSNIHATDDNKDLYIVKSPVSGTLEQFSGIYKGTMLQVGSNIAVVSPNNSLYLESYVKPRDIAFIHEGMNVKIQIESFNYNEWGTIDGTLSNVSSDYLSDSEGNYYYKVKVKLSRNYLVHSRTKRKGYLKKGMTAVAHFVVTKQSLFDLLYKNIDEWVNPTQYQINSTLSSH